MTNPGTAMPQLEEVGSDASGQQKRSLRARQLVNYKNNVRADEKIVAALLPPANQRATWCL